MQLGSIVSSLGSISAQLGGVYGFAEVAVLPIMTRARGVLVTPASSGFNIHVTPASSVTSVRVSPASMARQVQVS